MAGKVAVVVVSSVIVLVACDTVIMLRRGLGIITIGTGVIWVMVGVTVSTTILLIVRISVPVTVGTGPSSDTSADSVLHICEVRLVSGAAQT